MGLYIFDAPDAQKLLDSMTKNTAGMQPSPMGAPAPQQGVPGGPPDLQALLAHLSQPQPGALPVNG